MKRLSLFAFLLFGFLMTNAQSDINMAIVDFDAALERHPQYTETQSRIEAQGQQMQTEITELTNLFNTKLKEYQASFFSLSEADKKAKEEELGALDKRMQEAQQNFVTVMQETESKLMGPLETAVQEAINRAAALKGYNFVTSADLFYVADSNRDLTPLVIDILNQ